jgi:hypothetical protein
MHVIRPLNLFLWLWLDACTDLRGGYTFCPTPIFALPPFLPYPHDIDIVLLYIKSSICSVNELTCFYMQFLTTCLLQ